MWVRRTKYNTHADKISEERLEKLKEYTRKYHLPENFLSSITFIAAYLVKEEAIKTLDYLMTQPYQMWAVFGYHIVIILESFCWYELVKGDIPDGPEECADFLRNTYLYTKKYIADNNIEANLPSNPSNPEEYWKYIEYYQEIFRKEKADK